MTFAVSVALWLRAGKWKAEWDVLLWRWQLSHQSPASKVKSADSFLLSTRPRKVNKSIFTPSHFFFFFFFSTFWKSKPKPPWQEGDNDLPVKQKYWTSPGWWFTLHKKKMTFAVAVALWLIRDKWKAKWDVILCPTSVCTDPTSAQMWQSCKALTSAPLFSKASRVQWRSSCQKMLFCGW